MRGQVKATEIPHQVPEDDGVLAEELVGVDHLGGYDREVRITKEQTSVSCVTCSSCLAEEFLSRLTDYVRTLPDLPRSPTGSPAPCAVPRG